MIKNLDFWFNNIERVLFIIGIIFFGTIQLFTPVILLFLIGVIREASRAWFKNKELVLLDDAFKKKIEDRCSKNEVEMTRLNDIVSKISLAQSNIYKR